MMTIPIVVDRQRDWRKNDGGGVSWCFQLVLLMLLPKVQFSLFDYENISFMC